MLGSDCLWSGRLKTGNRFSSKESSRIYSQPSGQVEACRQIHCCNGPAVWEDRTAPPVGISDTGLMAVGKCHSTVCKSSHPS